MREIFDVIRQRWVAATPEEIVRQKWIQHMIGDLQFPRELLAVEKELKILPHLLDSRHDLPTRRIDLLCFMNAHNAIKPLLLMECKADALSQSAMDQAIAYNDSVKAPYVAIVNGSNIRFRYQLFSNQQEISRLPSFLELTEKLHG